MAKRLILKRPKLLGGNKMIKGKCPSSKKKQWK
jgi:hypothetical protein